MKCAQIVACLVLVGLGCPSSRAGLIAITEFMNNTQGTESKLEWLELYNYGGLAVQLEGYSVSDDNRSFTFGTGQVLGSGEYMILSPDPSSFEANWSLPADLQVVDWGGLALANSRDEISVKDPVGTLVWRLGYADDEDVGRATFLASDDFSVTDYGTELTPLIDRHGLDAMGGLGYESNDATAGGTSDPYAFSGTVDFGSPGRGGYSAAAVPEPSSLLMMGFATVGAACFRRWQRKKKRAAGRTGNPPGWQFGE